ncbi:hypothetical protein ACFQ88_05890 [Paenibacillus sp. NPDC056579]|uniref:hypothetical protein n=1 Tax=Paenibacillus sp. NPDC056579 TaxID=3345871 RepID=UPI0036A06DA7
MIDSKNGKILLKKEVMLEDSPFLDTIESRIGKRRGHDNTFYKVEYTINEFNNNVDIIAKNKHKIVFVGGPFDKYYLSTDPLVTNTLSKKSDRKKGTIS